MKARASRACRACRACIAALGGRAAGDDAVGAAVLAELRARGAADAHRLELAELAELVDAAHLVSVLLDRALVVLVDAVVDPTAGSTPGRVVALRPDQLESPPPAPALHGLGAASAIALARALAGPRAAAVAIVGVIIAGPLRIGGGLSHEVAAAVPAAAELALTLAERCAASPRSASAHPRRRRHGRARARPPG